MQEADGDRLDARSAQAGGERAALLLVERADDGAVRGDALVQLEAEVALDERRRLAPEEVVHVRDPQPAQLEHVAEAGGRDERRRRCRAARARRSSPPSCRGRPRRRAAGGEAGDRLDDGPVVARRRREQLADDDPAVGAVEDHVGERAADVDADAGRGVHSGRSSEVGEMLALVERDPDLVLGLADPLRPGLDGRPVGGGDDEDRVAVGDHLVAGRDLDAADRHRLADREHLLLRRSSPARSRRGRPGSRAPRSRRRP